MKISKIRLLNILLLIIFISTIFPFVEPMVVEVYAEAIYDRSVDFKTISADIAILSNTVEFENPDIQRDLQTFKQEIEKLKNTTNISDNEKTKRAGELNSKVVAKNSNITSNKSIDEKSLLKNTAKKYLVKVDKNKMKKVGVAKKSVDTYSEILLFQNEMMNDPENMFKMRPDPNKYPNLVQYWTDAKKMSDINLNFTLTATDSSIIVNPITSNAIVGNYATEIAGMIDCGYYGNEKPGYTGSWKTAATTNFANANNLLYSWGYHPTAWYVPTEGNTNNTYWTRGVTYHWWNCGYLQRFSEKVTKKLCYYPDTNR